MPTKQVLVIIRKTCPVTFEFTSYRDFALPDNDKVDIATLIVACGKISIMQPQICLLDQD